MAYNFVRASSQYLSLDSAPITDYPLTIACWYRIAPANLASNMLLVVPASSTTVSRISLNYNGAASPRRAPQIAAVSTSNVTGNVAIYAQTISSDTWYHAAAACSTSNFVAYYNGLPGATVSSTDVAVSGINRLYIGGRFDPPSNSATGFLDGNIAEVGMWNVALTTDEIASLAKGMTCNLVRPQSLVFYAPLIRNLQDVRGGLTLTNNNTATVANHPQVYR